MVGVDTLGSAMPLSSPWALALAGALVAIGLILWLGGHRVIRGTLVLLGIAIGSLAGVLAFRYVSADTLALPATGHPDGLAGMLGNSPLIAAIVGAALGGVLGFLLHRPIIAGASAALVAAASVGIAAAAFNIAIPAHTPNVERVETRVVQPASLQTGPSSPSHERDETLDPQTLAALARLAGDSGSSSDEHARRADHEPSDTPAPALAPSATTPIAPMLPESLRALGGSIIAHTREASVAVQIAWNELTVRERGVLTIAIAVGLALGFLLGVLAPRYAGGLTTASIGSAAWLAGAGVLATLMLKDASGLLEQPAWMWLSGWCAAAIVGSAWQWRLIARQKPTAARSAA